MPEQEGAPTTAERVTTILTCLAVDRRIGGVLFVDLHQSLLRPLARWLNMAMSDTPGAGEIVSLGSDPSADELWWQPAGPATDRFLLEPRPGPLVDQPDGSPRTVIIPDLARASLPAVQAALVLADADTAVSDRHGLHIDWRPRSRWLAACARGDLGRLSHHLLDRFAVRVYAGDLFAPWHDLRAMRKALDAVDDDEFALLDLPWPTVRGQWGAERRLPRMTPAAASLVIALTGDVSAATRRDLALARTARALAYLGLRNIITAEHVRHAAEVLGLGQAGTAELPPGPEPDPAFPDLSRDAQLTGPDTPRSAPAAQKDDPADAQPVPAGLDGLALPAGLLGARLYPEDDPGSVPEYASLREPSRRRSTWRGAARGLAVGTEPAQNFVDISFVATVLEAAKFTPIRHARRHDSGTELLIWGSDLRRYRRQPEPDTAVVVVLDHTARREWDWTEALAPYLRWAYAQRSAVTIVESGHADCADELRAEAYTARTVLDPRVTISLNRPIGRATPLAHALELGVHELRRQLRRSTAPSARAWFVVASDGRGNVPLEASLRGQVAGHVGREGVTDALSAVAPVRSLPPVRRIVLAPPELNRCADLPFELADAMGGMVAEVEP